jgi:hypothetical protein
MPLIELIAVWRDGALAEAVPATAKAIDLPAGTDATFAITLVDHLGKRVNLDMPDPGVDTFSLKVRSPGTGALVFSKAVSKSAASGEYTATIAASDTRDFSGRLILEAWVSKAAVSRRVIDPSHLILGLGYPQ